MRNTKNASCVLIIIIAVRFNRKKNVSLKFAEGPTDLLTFTLNILKDNIRVTLLKMEPVNMTETSAGYVTLTCFGLSETACT
jgi:hypothetical protein